MTFTLDRDGGAEVLKELAADLIAEVAAQVGAEAGPGAQVKVVVTDRVENAVIVPRAAVVNREGKDVVLVVRNGKAAELPVKTGLNDIESVAILEGLSDGEQVITAGQTIASAAETGVAPNGTVSLFNQLGSAHLVLDVAGYYVDPPTP